MTTGPNSVPPPPVPNSLSVWQKLRQNIHWARTHGWSNLLEEHDWHPSTRARRGLHSLHWRMTHTPATSPTTTFVVGAQRSGTNMMVYGLGNAPEVRMYNEGDRRAYDGFALKQDAVLRRLVRSSHYPHVVFKPLLDSHRLPHLLDLNGMPGPTKAVWAYRDVDGRVRSYLAKFGDINLRVFAAFARGELPDHWQLGGMDVETKDFVRSLDYDDMSPESGAALFWYVRNKLYFDLGLDRRPDVTLASYHDFLADPESQMSRLCEFLGIDYRPELIAHVERRVPATRRRLQIDGRIRGRCEDLTERLRTV